MKTWLTCAVGSSEHLLHERPVARLVEARAGIVWGAQAGVELDEGAGVELLALGVDHVKAEVRVAPALVRVVAEQSPPPRWEMSPTSSAEPGKRLCTLLRRAIDHLDERRQAPAESGVTYCGTTRIGPGRVEPDAALR